MPSEFEQAFPRKADRDLITHSLYQLIEWRSGHLLSFATVELTLQYDGYQQLADDAALGRRVSRWRARNAELAALLDAEAALDALAGERS